jgi:hypothetical protein
VLMPILTASLRSSFFKRHPSKSYSIECSALKRCETVICVIRFQATRSISKKSINFLTAIRKLFYMYVNACNMEARLVVKQT